MRAFSLGGAVMIATRGRVWERAPSQEYFNLDGLQSQCANRSVFGQKGFRIPRLHELTSLVATSAREPALMPGNPFVGIRREKFWTDDVVGNHMDLGWKWVVNFVDGSADRAGNVTCYPTADPNSSRCITPPDLTRAWCVRGP